MQTFGNLNYASNHMIKGDFCVRGNLRARSANWTAAGCFAAARLTHLNSCQTRKIHFPRPPPLAFMRCSWAVAAITATKSRLIAALKFIEFSDCQTA